MPDEFKTEHMWLLKQGHCLKKQTKPNLKPSTAQLSAYEEGSIDTLVRIVDLNGGYTLIPELHIGLLKKCQRRNVRPINYPEQVREIALVMRHDFVKERLVNILIKQFKEIVPASMVDNRLNKFNVKL